MRGRVVKHGLGSKSIERGLPAFDREVLARHTLEDAKLQREVLGLFFSQLAKLRARLEQGPVPDEEAKIMAHTLLGAARAVGAKRIEAIAAQWQHAPAWSQQLKLEIGRAMQEFLAEATHSIL
jgi:HPt (histidine-containing phosphotransfer) domain-containing protein